MKKYVSNSMKILAALTMLLGISGCSSAESNKAEVAEVVKSATFETITKEKAKEMMALDDGHIILDVRREDEFAEGHIPNAINIPNESIGSDPIEELSDLDQIILVYCRSGRRSKEAAGKLAALGYTNVYDFGGIIDWDGDVVVD